MLSLMQVDTILGQVREARKRGLKARYWDRPAWPIGLGDNVWNILFRESVGILNADDLEGAVKRNWGTD